MKTEKLTRILVAEDDAAISHLICKILDGNGYEAVPAFSGTEAGLRLDMETYDMLILDLMMPGMDGTALLEKLREEKEAEIPVLVLSARSGLDDKVRLLRLGADDYMTKPFEPEELTARVCALLRRAGKGHADRDETLLSYKALRLLPEARQVTVKGEPVDLTPHEFEILFLLLRFPDKVFSRETLYEKVWNGGYYGEDNTVNVHVSNLRKKLGAKDPGEEYIKTVWGIGFKMA